METLKTAAHGTVKDVLVESRLSGYIDGVSYVNLLRMRVSVVRDYTSCTVALTPMARVECWYRFHIFFSRSPRKNSADDEQVKVWWPYATLFAFIHSFIHFLTFAVAHLHIFTAVGSVHRRKLHGLPSRDTNSGLPYSKPAHYQLSHAASQSADVPELENERSQNKFLFDKTSKTNQKPARPEEKKE